MNWLGRQVGHVKVAVKTDAPKPSAAGNPTPRSGGTGKAPPKPASASSPSPSPSAAGGVVVYREDKVEEAEMPDRPGVILRRTIIDEVVVEVPGSPASGSAPSPGRGKNG